jgi:hypothetical protein
MNGGKTRARSFSNKSETLFKMSEYFMFKAAGHSLYKLNNFISLGMINYLSYVKAGITEYSSHNCKSFELHCCIITLQVS